MITGSALGSLSPTASLDQLVQQFRASERKVIVPVENRKTTLTARLNSLGELRTKIETLFQTVSTLSKTGANSAFSVYSVSSTIESVATASATSAASAGTHTLLVTQLAKADTVLSSQLTNAATDIITAEGAGTKTIRVTVNGVDTDVNVTLSTGETNSTVLSNIASAINASGANVRASVVSDTSTTSRLVLTSTTTGSSNAISLTDVSGTLLNSIGLTSAIIAARTASTSTTAGFVYSSTSSLDANFKLDGIDLVRGTNSVADALEGVTIELKGTQLPTDTPVTLKVGIDKEKVKASLQKFITDYNAALSYLRAKTSVDASTKVRQILAGDPVFVNLRVDLRLIAAAQVSSVGSGNPTMLSEIGIEAAEDGTLRIKDSAKVDEALGTDVARVADLFNSSDGIAVRLKTKLGEFVSSTGIVRAAQDGVNASLKSLNDRIARFNERLDQRAERFRTEFTRLQELMSRVARQQQAIQNLLTMMTAG
jgi:flagellar hook-associated protein 2